MVSLVWNIFFGASVASTAMGRGGAAAAIEIVQIVRIEHTTPKTYRAKVTRFSLRVRDKTWSGKRMNIAVTSQFVTQRPQCNKAAAECSSASLLSSSP